MLVENLMIIIKSGPEAESRVVEGLRLSAAMVGMDKLPVIVFLDEGVECLRPGSFSNPSILDFLQAVADLADVYVLSKSLEQRRLDTDELKPDLQATPVSLDGLVEMMVASCCVATF